MSNSFCDTKIKPESLKLLLIYTNFHKYLYGSQFSLNMKDFFFSIPRLESFEPRRVNILYQISKESHMVRAQSYCSVGLMHVFALHEPFIIYQTHSFQLIYPCTKPVFSLSLFLFYREVNWSHKCLLTYWTYINFSWVQLLSCVWLFVTSQTAAHQASLSITSSRSLLKLMFISSLMPSNYLILYCTLLLLPSIFPNIRVFSNVSVLHIRWPQYWSFRFNISPSNDYSGLISFRMDWMNLFAVQQTLKSSPTPQFKNINFSVLSFLYSPTLTSILLP